MITGLPPTPVAGLSGLISGVSLSNEQTDTSVTITPAGGSGTTIPAATTALAGMLDAARAAKIDDLETVALTGNFNDLFNTPNLTAIISTILDNNGSAIVAPLTRYFYIPFNATISGWAMMADISGSATVDVWKTPSISFPPTVANSIVGGAPMAISAAQSAFSGAPLWPSLAINAGDCLAFNLSTSSTIKFLTVQLLLANPS